MSKKDKNIFFYIIMVLPALMLMSLFLLFPTFWGVIISLTDLSLLGPSARHPKFVGLLNYINLLSDPLFYHSLTLTVWFVIGSAIIGQFLLGLFIAIITYGKGDLLFKIATGLMITSWILPETVFAYIWLAYLGRDGLLNQLLRLVGVGPIPWLVEYPLQSIIVANIWRGTAWSWMLFSSALKSVPKEIFDVADVDGVSLWQKARYITIPLIKRHIVTDLILITLWTFNQFGWVYAMTGGGPAFRTLLITIYAYLRAFKYLELGPGAAIAIVVFLINLFVTIAYLKLIRGE